MVEFTPHAGEEILRDGNWAGDWTPARAPVTTGLTASLRRRARATPRVRTGLRVIGIAETRRPSAVARSATGPAGSLVGRTFDNPPINLIDAVMMKELLNLLTEIERDKRVGVVLFDSADPDFFLAHYDIAGDPAELEGVETTAGRHPFTELHIRLSKSPAVTISAIRGRARGAGSEFVLATDIRFASRERAVLGQFEIGVGAARGGCVEPAVEPRRSRPCIRDPRQRPGLRRRTRRAIRLRQPRDPRRAVRRLRRCLRPACVPVRSARARRHQAVRQRRDTSGRRAAGSGDRRLPEGRRGGRPVLRCTARPSSRATASGARVELEPRGLRRDHLGRRRDSYSTR